MNDDATGATTATTATASTASAAAPDIADAATAAPPAVARPQATVKLETVKPETVKPEADPLFFSRLLRTQRLMEKDARAAKISSLSII